MYDWRGTRELKAVFIWAPYGAKYSISDRLYHTASGHILRVTVPMWVGSLREGGIKELKKVHAYRKKLFDKEGWEQASKTKGQAMTFDDKRRVGRHRQLIL